MKSIFGAAAMAVALAGAAQASTVTFEATVTGLSADIGTQAALAALGADPTATQMVFRWTVSDTPAVVSAPRVVERGYVADIQRIAYLSFSVTVGGVTLTGATTPGLFDGISMRDGVSEGTRTTEDRYEVRSDTVQDGPNGTTIEGLALSLFSADETTYGRTSAEPAFSGLGQPTLAELNALAIDGSAGIGFLTAGNVSRAFLSGSSITIRQIELAPVPLPAGAPMLLAGLGALVWLRRRRGCFA